MAQMNDQKQSLEPSISRDLATPLLVTLFALLAIQLLYHIPIAGMSEFAAKIDSVQTASFSIAAVALQSWLISATLMQLAVIILPVRWTHGLIHNGFINPFGPIVLLLTIGVAYSQASGVAMALESTFLPANGLRFQLLATGALMAGTAAFIAIAWLIERFGIGYGFWITLAVQSSVDMASTLAQWLAMINAGGMVPVTMITGLVILVLSAALIVLVTLHGIRNGGTLELVAWPLLLTSIPYGLLGGLGPKEMPEIILPMLIVMLLTLLVLTFGLARRGYQPRLFIPVVAALALVEIVSYCALSMRPFYSVELPLPTGKFVALIAVLTVLIEMLLPRRDA